MLLLLLVLGSVWDRLLIFLLNFYLKFSSFNCCCALAGPILEIRAAVDGLDEKVGGADVTIF